MSAAAVATRQSLQPSASPRMNKAVVVSVVFHAIVLILCIVGLPYFHHDLPDIQEPMSVELVKPAEMTQTNVQPMHAPVRTPPQQTQKPPPPHPVQPPQMLAPTPPKPVAPEKPQPPLKNVVPLPKTDDLAPPKKAPPKPVKPPEKKPPPVDKKVEEQQQQDFQSVLKNLMPSQPVAQATPEPSTNTTTPAPAAPVAQAMSSDELDALRKQLSECWSLMAGARYAEDLVVDIHMIVNPDRTVSSAEIVDTSRYSIDSYFRAAADSAKRAIFNPHCTPLDLPPDKYDLWKDITVTFDPKDML